MYILVMVNLGHTLEYDLKIGSSQGNIQDLLICNMINIYVRNTVVDT